jgi:gamma-glutamylputrescine oxidase
MESGKIVQASDRPAYTASWYTETMVASPDRGALKSDIDVDVCVVGAGLAGLTTARELARRGWSVAVLEARRIAWNASGRNTGFVLPGFAQSMDVVVRRVGLVDARDLWALSETGLDYVRNTIRDTDMPGVDPEPGWLQVSKTDEADHDLALVRLIGEELGGAVEGWPAERVREMLRSSHYFHAVHYPTAFHIHPLNYALGLAAAAEAAGARIFEATPVLSIDADGVRKRVTTPAASLRANHIVLAGNVHLGKVMPRIARTLLPVWTYVATTAPLGPRLADAIIYGGAVSDTDLADNHYRIVDGDRLMWSGGMTTWEHNPQRFVDQLKGDIQRVYPQLRDVEFEHVWTGVLGNTVHRMPQIGELSPRVWLASGFGGHGLNTTAMAGNLVARAIAEGDDTWRLFLPFELVWAGGRIGRAMAQVHYWWFHARELAAAREAQAREEGFRRKEDRDLSLPQAEALPIMSPSRLEPLARPVEPAQSRETNAPAAEHGDTTSITETAASLPVDEIRCMAPNGVTPAEPPVVSCNERPPHKAEDTSDAASVKDAPAAGRRRKSPRNTKKKPPVDTENV